jgi:RNA polymerase subunit RPABC4/transcription elongation factor Spt4
VEGKMELYCNKCGKKIEVTSGICPYCTNDSNTFYIDGGNIKDYHTSWGEISKSTEIDLWDWLVEIRLCVHKYLEGNRSDEIYITEALDALKQIEDYLLSLKV